MKTSSETQGEEFFDLKRPGKFSLLMSACNQIERAVLKLLRSFIAGDHGSDGIFKASSVKDLRTIAQRLYICYEIINLLKSDNSCSLRSLYYKSLTRYSGLFRDQASMTPQISILLNNFNVTRTDFRLYSSAKGLIASVSCSTKLFCVYSEKVFYDLRFFPEGLVITEILSRCETIETDAIAVVIFEKDAVFQRIARKSSQLKIIILTAKGFADYNTLNLIRLLAKLPMLRFFYVGDLDPYGLTIYFDYRNKTNMELVWLGLKAADVICMEAKIGIPLTRQDLRLIASLRKKTEGLLLCEDFVFMSEKGCKYECECLESCPSVKSISNWLEMRLREHIFFPQLRVKHSYLVY